MSPLSLYSAMSLSVYVQMLSIVQLSQLMLYQPLLMTP
jgi:hypothetical protein